MDLPVPVASTIALLIGGTCAQQRQSALLNELSYQVYKTS